MDFSELIAAANPSVLTESLSAWVSGLSINAVIMMIMMIFMILAEKIAFLLILCNLYPIIWEMYH